MSNLMMAPLNPLSPQIEMKYGCEAKFGHEYLLSGDLATVLKLNMSTSRELVKSNSIRLKHISHYSLKKEVLNSEKITMTNSLRRDRLTY